MFSSEKNNKTQSFIDELFGDELKTDGENTLTKYTKPDMLGAAKILIKNNKELQNKLNEKGELNMDNKDMELLENKFDKMLEAKLEKKFSGLESDLKNIKESNDKACTSGDCFADKLDEIDKKIEEFGDVKTSVFDLKLDINEKMKGVTDSISKMTNGFTDSITGMNEKLEETCVGVDCINKRLKEEDDMVKCPACGETFALSSNTLGDVIICPNCQARLE